MFSVSSQFSIETIVYFWEFVHFFWVAHFIGIILFIVISYNSLSFCSTDCNFFFISDFMICALFFLDESGYIGLSILFIFSKNQLLVSLIFSFFSFFLVSVYFCSDLYDFFSSSNFGFCFAVLFFFFFVVPLGITLGCLRSFVFPEVNLYHYKFLSLKCFCCNPNILDHCVFIFTVYRYFGVSS